MKVKQEYKQMLKMYIFNRPANTKVKQLYCLLPQTVDKNSSGIKLIPKQNRKRRPGKAAYNTSHALKEHFSTVTGWRRNAAVGTTLNCQSHLLKEK